MKNINLSWIQLQISRPRYRTPQFASAGCLRYRRSIVALSITGGASVRKCEIFGMRELSVGKQTSLRPVLRDRDQVCTWEMYEENGDSKH